MNINKVLFVLVLGAALGFGSIYLIQSRQIEQNKSFTDSITEEITELPVNPLEEYNFMSQKEIYNIRKKYVKTSLFANKNYEPDEVVFGQIEDGKPWWGLNQITCQDGDDNASGISAMSRFINNPNLLVASMFTSGLSLTPQTSKYCKSDYAKLVPYKLTYTKSKNLITAIYYIKSDLWNYNRELTLEGINARDFGYNYIYINNYLNIEMSKEHNASKFVYGFKDFIHTGGSCNMPGGCNNGSPYQSELTYYIKSVPAEIDIKLWKNQPPSPSEPSDINFKIIFEEP